MMSMPSGLSGLPTSVPVSGSITCGAVECLRHGSNFELQRPLEAENRQTSIRGCSSKGSRRLLHIEPEIRLNLRMAKERLIYRSWLYLLYITLPLCSSKNILSSIGVDRHERSASSVPC